MQGILLKNEENEICHLKVTCFKNHQQQLKIRLNSHLLWERNNPYLQDIREKIRIRQTLSLKNQLFLQVSLEKIKLSFSSKFRQ